MPEMMFGPPPATPFALTPSADEVAFFRENGFLVVERLTTDEEIDWLRRIYDHIFDPANTGKPGGPVDRSGVMVPEARGKLQQSFFPEVQFPEILQTNFVKNARRYAAALLDQPLAQLTAWGHLIKKSPGGRAASWHQDHAYWQPEFDYCALGVWMPMHDVPIEMGAMQFIPGSHRLTLQAEQMDELDFLRPEVPANQALFAQGIALSLEPGDVVLFHSGLFHAAGRNDSNQVKCSAVFAYHGKSNPPLPGTRSAASEDVTLDD